MPTPAILLFVKAPRPGAAKTRLTPFLTPEAAAEVAACLAEDAFRCAERCLPPGGRLVVVYAPDDGWPELETVLSLRDSHSLVYLPPIALRQRGMDLGERMANAVKEAAETHGFGPLVLIGADCPLMPLAAIAAAFRLLCSGENATGADVVIGPAEDGGYYLLGLRSEAQVTSLLLGVDWSTPSVRARTIANADRLGLRCVSDLPLCYDIDTPTDLVRLRKDLRENPELATDAPAISRWLDANPLPALSVADGDGHP